MEDVKRAAAVHDLSGYGRCSLTVVLPVLAAMGVSVSPAVTAYLSAHTGFPSSAHAVRQDMTAALSGTVEHWRELGVRFDAVYTGYLASEGQIAAAEQLIAAQPGALTLVDPVLGDHGAAYRGITPGHGAAMAGLIERADVITPNLTECAILLGQSYSPNADEGAARRMLDALSGGGRRSVVITGIRDGARRIGAAVLDKTDGRTHVILRPETPGRFSGTGDLFASVLLGALLRGEGLVTSAERAADFVAECAAYTARAGGNPSDGIVFEPLLEKLIMRV